MSDAALLNDQAEPLSPCINVCSIDEQSGYCRGCLRTLNEIAGWGGLSAQQKRHILSQLTARTTA